MQLHFVQRVHAHAYFLILCALRIHYTCTVLQAKQTTKSVYEQAWTHCFFNSLPYAGTHEAFKY
jgi:hypothetical protein